MENPEIKFLGDVQRLVFNEGDTLVLTVNRPISQEVAARLKQQMEDTFGKDRKYLILSEEMKIGVLAAE